VRAKRIVSRKPPSRFSEGFIDGLRETRIRARRGASIAVSEADAVFPDGPGREPGFGAGVRKSANLPLVWE